MPGKEVSGLERIGERAILSVLNVIDGVFLNGVLCSAVRNDHDGSFRGLSVETPSQPFCRLLCALSICSNKAGEPGTYTVGDGLVDILRSFTWKEVDGSRPLFVQEHSTKMLESITSTVNCNRKMRNVRFIIPILNGCYQLHARSKELPRFVGLHPLALIERSLNAIQNPMVVLHSPYFPAIQADLVLTPHIGYIN